MKRLTPVLFLSAGVAVGCTQFQDMRLEARQRRMARSAYVTSPGACNGSPHSVDYAKGFEEGYYDVASGGDGCPPALPPKKYWSATYNSPVGQEHVKAWFQGFRDGAAAAKGEGVASFGTIYVSDEHKNGGRCKDGRCAPGAVAPVVVPGTPLTPQPVAQPALPPVTGPQPVIIQGPGPARPVPVTPPNPTPRPMSDATKAPPLRDPQTTPPVPPPSAQAPEPRRPEPMAPAPMASLPLPRQAPMVIMPEAAAKAMEAPPKPAAPAEATKVSASIPAVREAAPTLAPRVDDAPSSPPRLKLPEFELPAGFTPETELGEPKALGGR